MAFSEYRIVPKGKIKIPKDYPREGRVKRSFSKKIVYDVVITKGYNLVDGLGRLQELKGNRVKVKVLNIPESERLFYSVILSVQHKDLNPIELGKSFRNLMKQNNWSGRQLAKELKMSKSTVEFHLKLLQLAPDVIKKISDGAIKPYSLERMVYKGRLKEYRRFEDYQQWEQFNSLTKKIVSFRYYLDKSKLSKESLMLIKDKILGVLKDLEARGLGG